MKILPRDGRASDRTLGQKNIATYSEVNCAELSEQWERTG